MKLRKLLLGMVGILALALVLPGLVLPGPVMADGQHYLCLSETWMDGELTTSFTYEAHDDQSMTDEFTQNGHTFKAVVTCEPITSVDDSASDGEGNGNGKGNGKGHGKGRNK